MSLRWFKKRRFTNAVDEKQAGPGISQTIKNVTDRARRRHSSAKQPSLQSPFQLHPNPFQEGEAYGRSHSQSHSNSQSYSQSHSHARTYAHGFGKNGSVEDITALPASSLPIRTSPHLRPINRNDADIPYDFRSYTLSATASPRPDTGDGASRQTPSRSSSRKNKHGRNGEFSRKLRKPESVREEDFTQMTAPTNLPRNPSRYDTGPLMRDSKNIREGLNRTLSRPISTISLPKHDNLPPSRMGIVDGRSYRISVMDVFSPRPIIQSQPDPYKIVAMGWTAPPSRADSIRIGKKPIPPSRLKRIDDLVDDMDATDLRTILEKDKLLKEKKKAKDAEKLQRKLERRAERDKQRDEGLHVESPSQLSNPLLVGSSKQKYSKIDDPFKDPLPSSSMKTSRRKESPKKRSPSKTSQREGSSIHTPIDEPIKALLSEPLESSSDHSNQYTSTNTTNPIAIEESVKTTYKKPTENLLNDDDYAIKETVIKQLIRDPQSNEPIIKETIIRRRLIKESTDNSLSLNDRKTRRKASSHGVEEDDDGPPSPDFLFADSGIRPDLLPKKREFKILNREDLLKQGISLPPSTVPSPHPSPRHSPGPSKPLDKSTLPPIPKVSDQPPKVPLTHLDEADDDVFHDALAIPDLPRFSSSPNDDSSPIVSDALATLTSSNHPNDYTTGKVPVLSSSSDSKVPEVPERSKKRGASSIFSLFKLGDKSKSRGILATPSSTTIEDPTFVNVSRQKQTDIFSTIPNRLSAALYSSGPNTPVINTSKFIEDLDTDKIHSSDHFGNNIKNISPFTGNESLSHTKGHPFTQSLASMDSEGSWLTGKAVKHSKLSPSEIEQDPFADDEYPHDLAAVSSSSNTFLPIINTRSLVARKFMPETIQIHSPKSLKNIPDSIPSPITVHQTIGRQPEVQRGPRVVSSEGILRQALDEIDHDSITPEEAVEPIPKPGSRHDSTMPDINQLDLEADESDDDFDLQRATSVRRSTASIASKPKIVELSKRLSKDGSTKTDPPNSPLSLNFTL